MTPTPIGSGLSIGPMVRGEADVLAGWAANEGWNPGNADIGIAWETDPDAFVALRKGDELVGGGTIISYGGRFGFMGLFIVRPDTRGGGLGGELWRYRLKRLRERLLPGAPIGMDGVFAMVPFYERGGFVFAHRNLRYQGAAEGTMDARVQTLEPSTFDAIDRTDRDHVPAPRTDFIRRWIFQPGAHALGIFENDRLAGYGVARPARTGFKIGPLFADRPDVAERLLGSLMSKCSGMQIQLDVPEPNQAGLHLAATFGLKEAFGCARMYCGPAPKLPLASIFGVTSFEFG